MEHELGKIKSLGTVVVMVVSQNSAEFADYLDAWESLIAQKVQAMLSGDVELILR